MRTLRTNHLGNDSLRHLVALIITTILFTSPQSLATTLNGKKCSDFSRDDWDKYPYYHLAVRVHNGDWLLIAPNEEPVTVKPHLQTATEDVQFCWAVPPAREESAQVVYVHTQYKQGQPISLFRTPAKGSDKKIQKSFYSTLVNWFEGSFNEWRGNLHSASCQFKFYHRSTVSGCRGGPFHNWEQLLDRWHETEAWDTHVRTRAFASLVIGLSLKDQEIASERLLRLNPERPSMSWVPFKSNPPKIGKYLDIKLVYSRSSADGSDLKVHSFKFLRAQ